MTQWIVADHKSWGDNISYDWTKDDYRHWHGHTWPHPKVGDTFVIEMKSGVMGEFTVTEVRPCGDPPDMWFANTERGGKIYEPPVLTEEEVKA